MPDVLPHSDHGIADDRPPVVLLHGFAGDALGWTNVQLALSRRRLTVAFDLPGHGRALDWPEVGHAGLSAKAVAASLDALGLRRVHLVGHSMGGAVASLIALRSPERIASLTLVAPGGFGAEIAHRTLRAFAIARSEAEIAPLLDQFFGFDRPPSRRMAGQIAESRKESRRSEVLAAVAEAILDGTRQKTVDRAALGDLDAPVKVIWGRQDRILPVHQADGLPGVVAVHRFDGVGHMPHLEAHREVARLIADQIRGD
ncbi:alpha/beta fold hydrolase [Chthonobacter rhizosphaerae]|uniref:alpha/beta fold hydrolase n=1 Tax=Chthonobacter rhizosphaerae TaxID=2735553 RepID=UPI001AEEDAC3|nr:alpha/beta fold hydrolase [Chthonobacter rhizosphaerae]